MEQQTEKRVETKNSVHYTQNGKIVMITPTGNNVTKKLPVATYLVKFSKDIGFYLSMIDDFSLPPKIYDNAEVKANRIINTFLSRDQSTGVLLAGEKGSGKTLLSKVISVTLARQNIATLIIDEPLRGPDFNAFIQNIADPCMILFDEFEKVYGYGRGNYSSMDDDGGDTTNEKNAQNDILILLDGVFPSKKLFVLTVNRVSWLNENLLSRPGRIFYRYQYGGITKKFIEEYCEDNLKKKKNVTGILQLETVMDKMNFDALKALVEEMNRYDETASQSIRHLNIGGDNNASYDILVVHKGRRSVNTNPSSYWMNPLSVGKKLIRAYMSGDPKTSKDWLDITITTEKLEKVDHEARTFHYRIDANTEVILSKVVYGSKELSELIY